LISCHKQGAKQELHLFWRAMQMINENNTIPGEKFATPGEAAGR
jgi:hypothetical protein